MPDLFKERPGQTGAAQEALARVLADDPLTAARGQARAALAAGYMQGAIRVTPHFPRAADADIPADPREARGASPGP